MAFVAGCAYLPGKFPKYVHMPNKMNPLILVVAGTFDVVAGDKGLVAG